MDLVTCFRRGIECLDVELQLPEERLIKLECYWRELLKWRQKVNLVSRTASEEEIVEKHFLDSLFLLPELGEKSRLLDIGTGAGFPGLVCRTALPQLGLVMVEPRQKRVHFLRHIIRTLELTKDTGEVAVYTERMSPDSDLCGERFTHITCRAVADIGDFFRLASGFAGSGADLLLMKGPAWEEELDAARPTVEKLGYRLEKVGKIILPFSGAERFLLNFTETGE